MLEPFLNFAVSFLLFAFYEREVRAFAEDTVKFLQKALAIYEKN